MDGFLSLLLETNRPIQKTVNIYTSQSDNITRVTNVRYICDQDAKIGISARKHISIYIKA